VLVIVECTAGAGGGDVEADIEELRHTPDFFDRDKKAEGAYVAETGPQCDETGACLERWRGAVVEGSQGS
jgi:hypothetical protein